MKLFYTLFFFLLNNIPVNAQRFDGQWKGGFTDNSSGFVGFGGDKIDYVLELECHGSNITGYSYTYFMGGAKRYYTICKLKGTLYRSTKEIVVTEFERTKYNTPPDFRNCFQTHRLRYVKDSSDVEILEGSWMPAPHQSPGCGFGKTTLTKRLMKNLPVISNTMPSTAKKNTPYKDLNKGHQSPPLALKQKTSGKEENKKPLTSAKPIQKNDVAKNDKETEVKNTIPIIIPEIKMENRAISPLSNFEKRTKSVLRTIEIQEDSFRVQLYDNGEIDGDSVSVFYNGSLLVSHKGLSDKPITLSLALDKSSGINELTMYAENLGTIPPNTALLIVTDGNNRYEVRITSDTEKNGTIAFVHKKR
ncbi:MAG: hypothetical protein ABIO55_11850 [Ginsengibacter sp.]